MIRYLSLGFVCLFLHSCYYVDQGRGQLALQFKQIPLKEAVASTKDPQIKSLLQKVSEIKKFGRTYLGLADTDNYQGYYATDQKGITFVVTAAPKLKLEPYTWWFPVIGSVPYKGYFNQADAEALQRQLITQGYDVYLFAAPAYSTLGWFKDPITTPMLRGGLWGLADSILHEMAHATLYVNNQGDFNEQLASFVGKRGSLLYLQTQEHWAPEKIKLLQERKRTYQQAQQDIFAQIQVFREVYADSDLSKQEKLDQRAVLFSQLDHKLFELTGRQWGMNNAKLLQYQRCKEDNPLFSQMLQKHHQNWTGFWQDLKGYVNTQGW